MSAAASVDPVEVERFSRMAAEWWDPKGKFKPLHKFNPVRLAILKRELCHRFGRDMRAMNALAGLTILDIGCGGGLVAEPLARLGATVTGIDPSPVNVDVARLHAADTGTAVDYRATTAEDLAMEGARFDAVLALEVVEHVDGVPAFLATVASLVKPGGLVAVATINRTPKAYALAIVGAERVLRWLPPGTHSYDKLVTPNEVETPLKAAGLDLASRTGVVYDPLRALWKESRDTDVNYMVFAGKAG